MASAARSQSITAGPREPCEGAQLDGAVAIVAAAGLRHALARVDAEEAVERGEVVAGSGDGLLEAADVDPVRVDVREEVGEAVVVAPPCEVGEVVTGPGTGRGAGVFGLDRLRERKRLTALGALVPIVATRPGRPGRAG